jgi:hypothetical protein
MVPLEGFEPSDSWLRRPAPIPLAGALFGAVSGIRTRTVQILSLLSPTNCTITALHLVPKVGFEPTLYGF